MEVLGRSAICTYESAKGDAVPDSTTRAIDRFFDGFDNAIDTASRVLNRGKQTEEKLQEQRTKRRVIDTPASSPKDKPKTAAKAAATAAVPAVKKPHFYIVEAAHPKTGETIYVVTDGGNARTECATREFANQILKALEKTP
jgi:hypothetical protein